MPVEDVTLAIEDHKTRATGYDVFRDYEEGRHRYPYASQGFQAKFGWILRAARANACYTVRSNFTDLVQVQAWSGAGAEAANRLAETTDLDMVIDLAVSEAWRCGDAYVLAWPGEDGTPRPWYHRADQAGYRVAEGDPSTLEVAWKIWVTAGGYGRVNLYYADRVERWATLGKVRVEKTQTISWDTFTAPTAWGPFSGDGEPDTQPHQFGRVPWVHVPFDAQAQGGRGRSILRDVIPLQDGLNHAVHAIVVNTERYAAPLRALFNHEPVSYIDPNTGQQASNDVKVDETKDSIFAFRGTGPLVQLDPPSSENILAVKRDWHTDIANTVGVPVSDVVPDLGNIPSGAALRVLAARRTNTVRSFNRAIRGRLASLMGLLGVPDAYPEFLDPAPVDETERLANAQARIDLGYPLAEVLPDLGEDPDDVKRILEAVTTEQATLAAAGAAAIRAAREDPGVMGRGGT